MEEINIRNILNTYKMFSKRQNEILENLVKTREFITFDDLQKELKEDTEAKELFQKIRFIVNREYEKAGICKSVTNSKQTTDNNKTEKIELFM